MAGIIFSYCFVIGGLLGVLAVLLSFLWHYLDKKLEAIEPEGNETFEEADTRWRRAAKIRDIIRIAGLFCLYGCVLGMSVSMFIFGIQMLEPR